VTLTRERFYRAKPLVQNREPAQEIDPSAYAAVQLATDYIDSDVLVSEQREACPNQIEANRDAIAVS
jgi:hypothetical protein